MKHHVFLSYSRRDLEVMKKIHDLFQSLGITVWTDEGIETGTRSWKRAIEDAILNAGCLVCLLSPDGNQSEWVRAEIEFAELHDKPIYLVLVRGDERSAIPFGFAAMQWVDVRQPENLNVKIKSLAEVIREKLSLDQVHDVADLSQLIRLGNFEHYQDQHEKAIRYYTEAIEIDAADHALYLNRGTSYLELGLYGLALEDFHRALQIDPQNHITLYRMGVAYAALGQFTSAIEVYSTAIDLYPQAKTYFERGNALFDEGKYDKAIIDYTEVLKIDHENAYSPSAYNNRGESYILMGQYSEALADFEQAREMMDDYLFADAGKAIALFMLERPTEAFALWETLIETDEDLTNPEYIAQRFHWAEAMVTKAVSLLTAMQGR